MNATKRTLLLSLLALAPLGGVAIAQNTPAPVAAPEERGIFRMLPILVTPTAAEQNYLNSYNRESGSLFPVSIRQPYVGGIHAGESVDLSLTIGANGVPKDVQVTGGTTDTGLIMVVKNAVSEWKFSPRYLDGTPVDTRASLNISIVPHNRGL